MNRVLELRQQRAALIEQAGNVLKVAADEKRAMTSEEDAKYNKIFDDAQALQKTIEAEERQANILATLNDARDQRKQETGEDPEQRRVAFVNMLRVGAADMAPEQRSLLTPANPNAAEFRAQSVGTNSAGGYVVPQGFYADVIAAQKWFGGMFSCGAKLINTNSGNDLPVPTANDTGNVGAILAENTQTSTQDITFANVTLKAFKYSSNLILVSYELLQDAGVDIEAFLVQKIAERLARIQNTHFTVGTGSSQPRGVVIDATLGKTGANGQTTSIIYNDLVDLKYSVDKAYRQNAKWMMNDSTMKALLKLVDGQSRPLFYSYTGGSLQSGEADTLLGNPIVINNDIADMATSAKSVLFGDFSNYWIRNVMSMMLMRLTERYADYGQVGFLAFMRADGRTVDAGGHPIKYYANSAS